MPDDDKKKPVPKGPEPKAEENDKPCPDGLFEDTTDQLPLGWAVTM